jgi:hypothetical protein
MSGIVCAIRGGPGSQPTIARSISLAQETGETIYYLYVVNLDFLSHTSSSRVHTISEQMTQMGEFILLMAQDTAVCQGVAAERVIRHGAVQAEIIALCHELEANYLVLGRPKVDHGDAHFTQDMLHTFVERTEEQTGATVVFPEGEAQ